MNTEKSSLRDPSRCLTAINKEISPDASKSCVDSVMSLPPLTMTHGAPLHEAWRAESDQADDCKDRKEHSHLCGTSTAAQRIRWTAGVRNRLRHGCSGTTFVCDDVICALASPSFEPFTPEVKPAFAAALVNFASSKASIKAFANLLENRGASSMQCQNYSRVVPSDAYPMQATGLNSRIIEKIRDTKTAFVTFKGPQVESEWRYRGKDRRPRNATFHEDCRYLLMAFNDDEGVVDERNSEPLCD